MGSKPAFALRCTDAGDNTRVEFTYSGGEGLRGQPKPEQDLGWLASEILAPTLLVGETTRVTQWAANRTAGRPSGPSARAHYREPRVHLPGFRIMLGALGLTASDRLIEVGCGGGSFLRLALKSGCTAAAVDHSPDMLEVARLQNARAITTGRLHLAYSDAAVLPFPSGRYTCAVMSGVLPWLPDPVKAFREVFRVLRPGGKFVAWSATPKAYGTPAGGPRRKGGARLYTDRKLKAIGAAAGFGDVRIVHPDLRPEARRVGISGRDLDLFGPDYNHMLWARK